MVATKNVIWSPQPKQKLFMSLPDFDALYGGAAGGGKSDALVVEATRQVNHPTYNGLILRRTYPELAEIINRSLYLYPRIFPGAKFNDSKHYWTFPSGAHIVLGSMQHDKDKLKYQGQQFQFIGIDEATHFSLEAFDFLMSRCRANSEGQRCYMRLTANPGGPGHGWVKNRYVDLGANKRTFAMYTIDDGQGNIVRKLKSRIYIPATVFDNKKLLQNSPEYIATLASINDRDKNAFLYGNWDVFSGQAFSEWKDDPAHYKDRRYTHVVEPFTIPAHWQIYRAYDFGYAKPFSVGWYAVSPDGPIYRIKELYGWNGTPNQGLRWDAGKQAAEIAKFEKEDEVLKHFTIYGIADPAIWECSSGESIANIMMRNGIYFDKGDHKRIAGKQQCHYRLAFDENGYPQFQVFNTCKQFLRTIPAIPEDTKNVEDVDSSCEDHIYDEWRYLMMRHPIAPVFTPQVKKPYNPLDTEDDRQPYSWVMKYAL